MSDAAERLVAEEGAGPSSSVINSSSSTEQDSVHRVGSNNLTYVTTLAEASKSQQPTDQAERLAPPVSLLTSGTAFASPQVRGILGSFLSAQRDISGSPFLRRAVTAEEASQELAIDASEEPSCLPVQLDAPSVTEIVAPASAAARQSQR